eukprot:TRINITY_DN4240_c0_g1_i1.p1 TRINITY_DN4240_c0_g1~~TRINITY_DN4240_c0_g1_i1.p1  ORF type:complete len:503 (+),score=149.34 TRINITY_DN4240_c0_g1_i1:33-1511(+)
MASAGAAAPNAAARDEEEEDEDDEDDEASAATPATESAADAPAVAAAPAAVDAPAGAPAAQAARTSSAKAAQDARDAAHERRKAGSKSGGAAAGAPAADVKATPDAKPEKRASVRSATGAPVAEVKAPGPVLYEGALTVLGVGHGSGPREGEPAYFVLRPDSLEYFDSRDDFLQGKKYKGHVYVDNVDLMQCSNTVFSLGLVNRSAPLQLRASEEDLDDWRHAFRELLGADRFVDEMQSRDFEAFLMQRAEQRALERAGGHGAIAEQSRATPWRKARSARFKVKGLATYKESEPNDGAPVPVGFVSQLGMELTRSADFVAAFHMLDPENSGLLGRTEARNFFRCLGWCVPERVLDETLDEVDVEGLSPVKQRKKPRVLRGPWTLQQLRRAHQLLHARTPNEPVDHLRQALQTVLHGKSQQVSYADLRAGFLGCSAMDFGSEFTEEDIEEISEAIHFHEGSEPISCESMALRIVARIVNPESTHDHEPKRVTA